MVSTALLTIYFGGRPYTNEHDLSLFLLFCIPNQNNISLFPRTLFTDNFLLQLLKYSFGIGWPRQYDIDTV